MNYLQETAKGFFWAIGFVVIALGTYFLYSIGIRVHLDREYNEEMRKDYNKIASDGLGELKPEVISYTVKGEKIFISSRAKNVNVYGNMFFLRLSIFSNKPNQPVAVCNQPLMFESGNPEFVYYQTICETIFFNPGSIKKIEARIAMNVSKT